MPATARFALACLFATGLSTASLAAPQVVATIKPIHSIAANVMKGVADPQLLLDAAVSEHTAQLTPSQVQAMQDADLIVAVGENLEAFLHKALENPDIGRKKVFEAAEAPGVKTLPARDGGLWEPHSHEGEAEDTHEAEGHDHDHGGNDPHIWMDPENAKAIAQALANTLSDLDSANAAQYRENAAKFAASLDRLSAEIKTEIAPLRDRRYIVFHDAYQYFEARFGMNPAGSITVNPEATPGARRLKEIHDRIAETKALCVFAEPQFEPKYVETVIEGTRAKSAVLDGLGAAEAKGPDAYAGMMRRFVKSLVGCLGSQ
ncbi:zinc ABC transporter solute-binding protein [Nordella sp. HKS 07]|uniref:zinc ABC transporter substrate-binding protein n=1 Tax=Nordella sp. HKS 07 TaxID=2712222 RepID=UPI0013E1B3CC|nr:zinc ABC transporter substrate-binding protein [Nordella sp. HKS 07]QIG47013.1 zinc ABC transporter solute-binding protein [Nordella sp. HKS 07]